MPGLDSSRPMGTTAWAGTSAWWRIQYSWKCTALRSPDSGSSMTTCVSTRSSVIGNSSTPGSPASQRAQRGGDGAERVARLEHLGAHEVGGDVPVAQAEPARFHAVRRELLLGVPGLLPATPAPVGVDAVAEGVHHGVQVGAHLEPVHPDVVGRVGHDGHRGGRPGALDEAQQSLQEPRAADAAGEHGDALRGAPSWAWESARRGAHVGIQTWSQVWTSWVQYQTFA